MLYFTGNRLKRRTDDLKLDKFKKRDCFSDLESYLESDNLKICCLYGLRRTGKTTMMYQAIKELDNYNDSLYILCTRGDTFYNLMDVLDENNDKKYIFIDEASFISDFINSSSVLSDYYLNRKNRIVIGGTDSLAFALAARDELYDRETMIHTSYISYKEYRRLLGKSLMDYIRYGGTLTDGKTLYNNDHRGVYTNYAITENIANSLANWGRGNQYDSIKSGVYHHDIASAINRVLESGNAKFLESVVNDDFHSHTLGSLRQLLNKNRKVNPSLLSTAEMEDRIRIFLQIKEYNYEYFETDALDELKEYLMDLDVVWHIGGRDIFVQPGLRYAQCQELSDALVTSDVFAEYTEEQRQTILSKLESDICGQILEDIIVLQVSLNKILDVRKIRNRKGNEIDMLVTDEETGKSFAAEIKLSDKNVSNQWRHLNNEDFCDEIENRIFGGKIINKAVIYMGKTKNSDDWLYVNAEAFLKNDEEYLNVLLDHKVEAKDLISAKTPEKAKIE